MRSFPRHVAIVMDGNGRWAEQRGLPRWRGHAEGAQAVRRAVEAACELRIAYLTLFAFSSENWKRPAQEIGFLFDEFARYLAGEREELLKNEIRLSVIGRRDRLPSPLAEALEAAEAFTRQGRRLHLRLAVDYGGRQEIAAAARRLAEQVARGRLPAEQIDESLFGRALAADSVPDPDLIIRTAGQRRLSNFLLWQASYSELYFTAVLWPDFTRDDFFQACQDFQSRKRTFGAVPIRGLRGLQGLESHPVEKSVIL